MKIYFADGASFTAFPSVSFDKEKEEHVFKLSIDLISYDQLEPKFLNAWKHREPVSFVEKGQPVLKVPISGLKLPSISDPYLTLTLPTPMKPNTTKIAFCFHDMKIYNDVIPVEVNPVGELLYVTISLERIEKYSAFLGRLAIAEAENQTITFGVYDGVTTFADEKTMKRFYISDYSYTTATSTVLIELQRHYTDQELAEATLPKAKKLLDQAQNTLGNHVYTSELRNLIEECQQWVNRRIAN